MPKRKYLIGGSLSGEMIKQGLVKYEDAEYEVESIQDHNYEEAEGKMYYLIKWRGWPMECSTWEPEADLIGCPDVLKDYKNFNSGQSRKRSYQSSVETGEAAAERSKARVVQLLGCINFAGLTPEQFESVLADTLSKRVLLNVRKPAKLPAMRLKHSRDSRRSLAAKMQTELKLWEAALNAMEPQARIVIENKVDLEGPPAAFTYVTQRVPGPGVSIPSDPVFGCTCTDCFAERRTCVASHVHNEGRVPYNRQGRLANVDSGYPIHECNSLCRCGPDCPFRVVQRGRRYSLAICRTRNRGWGVRAHQRIPRGAFVVEYVGEVVTSEEAERRGFQYDREGQTYLFDLDLDGEPVYSVDARKYGNVAHFLNHSCSPNLTIRCVYTQCIDRDLPLLALFAAETIACGAELTFDYQMSGAIGGVSVGADAADAAVAGADQPDAADAAVAGADQHDAAADDASRSSGLVSVSGVSGSVSGGPEKIRCLCGAANCRRYLFD